MSVLIPKQTGVLSLNARALDYTTATNIRSAVRLANDKLATKRILQKAGIPTPRLFAVIENRTHLKSFQWTKLPPSFVIKPNSSSGGGGILVVFGRNKKGNWVKADKTELFIPQLHAHTQDILDGNFSRTNIPDSALIEQRVKNHSDLKQYSVKGIPDVRVLVYNSIPVMAMLRCATEESNGRANLHVGGIGMGIDMAKGVTTTAVYRNQLIDMLPDKPLKLAGIQIPYWEDILLTAVRTAQAVGLTFAGIDIAIDRDDGPMVLESNARPGLSIQLANMAPLVPRLRRVEGLKITRPEKAVRLAQELFGSEAGDEQATHTILGIEEKVVVMDTAGQPHTLIAKVDTGAYRTAIDESIAKEYGLHKVIVDEKSVTSALGSDTRSIVEVTIKLRRQTIKTKAFLADRSHLKYDMIIGRRDLKGFLVDPHRRLPTA